MNIDDIDFTRYWCVFGIGGKILSRDECDFFGATWEEMTLKSSPSPAREYARKVATYYERFQNHMPIPLRKALLRELAV